MPRRVSAGEIVALAASLLLVVLSLVPYWASLELISNELLVFGGPTGFTIWDAYPTAAAMTPVIALVIVGIGVFRLVSRTPSIASALYVGGGAVITLLMLYGVYQGPTGLLDDPFFQLGLTGDGPASFAFHRGPLIYVGLAAGVTILIGGFLALRDGGETRLSPTDL